LKILGHELMLAISFLEENDLIDYSDSEKNYFKLSEKGFNVALQNEKIKYEQKMQKSLLVFTSIIAISSFLTFMSSLGIYKNAVSEYILIWSFTILLIGIAILIYPIRFRKKEENVL